MVLPVVGGDGKPTGYEIDNSLRFNTADDAFMQRTFTAGTRTKFTISCWVKRGNLSGNPNNDPHRIIDAFKDQNNVSNFFFETDDTLRFFHKSAGTTYANVVTNRLFRDPTAWYHLVCAVDTTQSTESNRIKFYVNGVQETSFSTYSVLENLATFFNDNTRICTVGAKDSSSAEKDHFDGYMADFYYVDNQQYDQTYFGETNDNGVWIPVEKGKGAGGDLTFGTNGFFLEFQQTGTSANSSGMGADTSGNDLHLTPNNLAATDVTEDTPTNNFATLLPALNMQLSEGNTKAVTTRTGNWDGVHSSIGVTNGKWYFETKASTSGTFRVKSGIVGNPETFTFLYNGLGGSGDPLSSLSNTYPAYGKGVWLSHWYDQNYNSSSTASSQSSGDILQFALDLDNYKLWVGINGQFKDNSNNNVSYSDVASGNSATVTIASAAYTGKTFFPDVWLRDDAGSDDNIAEINFGNPSFSISSGNSDGK